MASVAASRRIATSIRAGLSIGPCIEVTGIRSHQPRPYSRHQPMICSQSGRKVQDSPNRCGPFLHVEIALAAAWRIASQTSQKP